MVMGNEVRVDQRVEIPLDILEEILKCVDSYGDYIRFCAVCKSWNLPLPQTLKYLKVPLLLLPFDDENSTVRPTYHFGEKKIIHKLELFETKNTLIFGSCYGWLITLGLEGELQILEPFIRYRINLPPVFTFPDIVNYQFDNIDKEYTAKSLSCDNGRTSYWSSYWSKSRMQRYYIQKIILSCPPKDDDQEFMGVAIYGEFRRLAYCLHNDKRWKDFIIPIAKSLYEDVIFHEGRIYALSQHGNIDEYDVKTKVGIPKYKFSRIYVYPSTRYLVSTSDGLLVVERYVKQIFCRTSSKRWYYTYKFKVYKLSESKWIEVESLGDNIIVVGTNLSTCYAVPHGKGNCIYFSDDRYECHYLKDERQGGHDNGSFYLQDKKTIHYTYLGNDAIFPPPLWLL